MNCAQCQTANNPGTAYCVNCGARLNAAGAPAYSGGPGNGSEPGYGGSAYSGPGYDGQGYSGQGYGGHGYSGPDYSSPGYGTPAGNGPRDQYQPGQYQQGQPGQGQPGQYQPGQSGSLLSGAAKLPPVRFDLTRLTTVDKIVAGATLLTMVSLWLPWFTGHYSALGESSTGTVSGTGLHGWLWLEFILALALVGYLAARAAWDTLPFRLPVPHELVLIAGTGLQLLLVVIGFLARPSTDGIAGFTVSWDFGAFLALLGSLAAAGPVIYPAVKAYLDRRGGTPAQRY